MKLASSIAADVTGVASGLGAATARRPKGFATHAHAFSTQNDHGESPLSASDQRVDWTSLLNAIGTRQFELAFRRCLSTLGERKGCVTFFHGAMSEPVTGCDMARGCDPSQAACRSCGRAVNGSPHWIHFEDGPWRAAIAVLHPGPLHWTESSQLDQRLVSTGSVLAAILRKHMSVPIAQDKQPEPLSCLRTIERCLASCTDLSPREIAVCSRILYGLTSAGIAADLDICETTVKTYRKRAYQRLSLGGARELITWYLRAWACWQPAAELREAT